MKIFKSVNIISIYFNNYFKPLFSIANSFNYILQLIHTYNNLF